MPARTALGRVFAFVVIIYANGTCVVAAVWLSISNTAPIAQEEQRVRILDNVLWRVGTQLLVFVLGGNLYDLGGHGQVWVIALHLGNGGGAD